MIVFNGEDIILHKVDGQSNFTLITFMGVNFHGAAEHLFFLKKIAEKFNFRCYGISTKKPNWYISDEIDECVKIIDMDTKATKRILIGPSMGGFAAIKYSKKFKADIVFSMAPQYTIDPNEEMENNHYKQFYLPNMKDMSIKEKDTHGKIFIAIDPLDKGDTYQAKRILSLCPNSNIKITPVFYAKHIVYNSISGSNSIKKIIQALSTGNFQVLFAVLTKERKKNINNIKLRVDKDLNKHPKLVAKTIISELIERKHFLYQDSDFILSIAYRNYILKNYDIVNNIKNQLIFYSKFDANFDIDYSRVFHQEKFIVDYRGKILTLDKNLKNINFLSYNDSQKYGNNLSVFLQGPFIYISLNFFDKVYFISIEDNSIVLSRKTSRNVLKYDPINNLIVTNYGYLQSKPDGSCSFNSKNTLDWETFAII